MNRLATEVIQEYLPDKLPVIYIEPLGRGHKYTCVSGFRKASRREKEVHMQPRELTRRKTVIGRAAGQPLLPFCADAVMSHVGWIPDEESR